jgi:Pyruvate flavodoxin/ferredoxin oxidoreductase, thiamine diP-bdg
MTRELLTGNAAAAWGARLADVDYVPAFPITPQTEIIETLARWSADGTLRARLVTMDSEHSMLTAAGAAAATGARVFTASSSQGLLYGFEMLYAVAGWRVPLVLVNVSSTLTSGAMRTPPIAGPHAVLSTTTIASSAAAGSRTRTIFAGPKSSVPAGHGKMEGAISKTRAVGGACRQAWISQPVQGRTASFSRLGARAPPHPSRRVVRRLQPRETWTSRSRPSKSTCTPSGAPSSTSGSDGSPSAIRT